jgi:hypothetical protein
MKWSRYSPERESRPNDISTVVVLAAMAEEESLGELSEVYEALRKDAKSLVEDFADSVDAMRSDAELIVIAGFCVAMVTIGLFASGSLTYLNFLLLELVGVSLLAVGLMDRVRSSRLQRKYHAMFSAAEKLK